MEQKIKGKTMKTECIKGQFEDGSKTDIIKITELIRGSDSVYQTPSYKLPNGEKLTPVDDKLLFKSIHTNRTVTIIG